jgi:D-arginine dehydrogenase
MAQHDNWSGKAATSFEREKMSDTTSSWDAIVIGAGMAGASVAYFMSPYARVLVLEREPHVGMHSTGRSAALFTESYGSPQVRALTRASRRFLHEPAPGFAPNRLVSPRGALVIGGQAEVAQVEALYRELRLHSPDVQCLAGEAVRAMVPVLEPAFAQAGLFDPNAADIDVHELHQGYLRGMRARGGQLVCDVAIDAIEHRAGRWELSAPEGRWASPLLVNAAGAWVDQVAALAGVAPIGIQPRRRSAFLFAPPPGLATAHWPLVIDVGETFYFKPDAGLLLGSPANADPVEPQDVQPEALDIALGIHRIEAATTLRIRRPTRTWAGLRSFVADGDLVGGFARGVPGFFWVAAQGGYGIQTSPAMGEACACLALGRTLPAALTDAGISAAMLDLRPAMCGT